MTPSALKKENFLGGIQFPRNFTEEKKFTDEGLQKSTEF